MLENQSSESNETPIPPAKGFNRRLFLGGMFTTVAAWAAAACGGSDATPTPTLDPTATTTPVARSSLLASPVDANKVYLPFIENADPMAAAMAASSTPEATAIPTDTPTIEPTPTKKPTKTPKPEPTAVPPATPFPPGPPSKLGVVVARNDPGLFDLLATHGVAVVSTLELDPNFAAQIKQTAPNTRLIGRLPDKDKEQIDLSTLADPAGAARSFVEQLLTIAGDEQRQRAFDGWQSYNEPIANNPDEMKRWAEFEAERTRLLAARGIRSVIGNFGTGQPQMELWPHFLPAVQAAKENDGWLALHEYAAPTIYFFSTRDNNDRYPGVSPEDTGWLTLRYRHVYNEVLKPAGLGDIPLVFTELGVDGTVRNNRPGPQDARGWQDFQGYWAENGYGLWGPGAYIEQLVWFDQAMRQDDYVIGGCIYALAASQGWESYDILGPAAAVLKQYLSVHSSTRTG